MTSSVQRFAAFLERVPFADALLARLPETARDVLRDVREAAGQPSDGADVRRGELGAGATVRAASFVLGAVREGASVRVVNVLKGDVDGGSVRGVNLLVGDVLHGEVRAVNVLVGDVRGGTLRDVHLVVGDVFGGRFERCHAVIGDVHGGEGRVGRVIGRVMHDGLTVDARTAP